MRLIDFFDRRVALHPDKVFLIDDEVTRCYGESHDATHRIANILIDHGCVQGSKVAVFSPNLGRAFECILGIVRAGCAWVPLNARNGLEENRQILQALDVEVLLYHQSVRDQANVFLQRVAGLRHVLCIDGAGVGDLPALMRLAEPRAPAGLGEAPGAVTAVFPTGGTTGASKGAVWTNATWHTMMANMFAAFPLRRDPVNLVVAPMTHAAGCVALVLMAAGASFVILPAFSTERVSEAIERYKVTHLFLPPTAIYMLLDAPGIRSRDYTSLDYFIYAAAPMSVDKLQQAIAVFGPVMAQTFGQAEAPMFCTAFRPQAHADALEHHPRRLASCGQATVLTDVAIMDDNGHLLKPGEVGEIVVRGPLVMAGYYKNEPATREVSAFGWHHTSDLGYRDSDGYYYIVDRKRDVIISGGFNVYPSEIEQVLWSHPDVQDCAVIGVPDEKWGERVKAVVEPRPGHTPKVEELAALCRAQLGSVKTPKEFELRSVLPRSAVGKVLKRALRDEAWAATGRKV